MSFNIRFGDAADGDDAWPHRRDALLALLGEQAPMLLGLQEAMGYQIDAILDAFPQYAFSGRGHRTGAYAEEHAAILFDKTQLTRLQHGTFWYADAPETPGSTSWGNEIPRTCSWARFRCHSSGQQFCVYNSHWDHEQEAIRERSAQLLRQQIQLLSPAGEPLVVMGDFNCGEQAPAQRQLLAETTLLLRDSFRVLHPDAENVGSFHQFTGSKIGDKIDAVLVSPHWRVSTADIITNQYLGRYPSDHFPVTAVLELAE